MQKNHKIALLIQAIAIMLPWGVRRIVLSKIFGYEIDKSARIGFSIVLSEHIRMEDGAKIGHLNIIRGLHQLELERNANISHLNWIYAVGPESLSGDHIRALRMKKESSITRRHMIDCSNEVSIGELSVVAGYGTQIISHGINIKESTQEARTIKIGDGCMVGTRCVLLGGSQLPNRSVLGAGSVLRNEFHTSNRIYSGVPAVEVGKYAEGAKFFTRASGYI